MALKKISVVIPLFNEAENVETLIRRLYSSLSGLCDEYQFEVIFVDDGSIDDTVIRCKEFMNKISFAEVRIIALTRNFGHEAALTAGMDYASGDAAVFLDGDLQHPPEIICEFLKEWSSGAPVVLSKKYHLQPAAYGTAKRLFFWVQNRLSTVKIPSNYPDYFLIDAQYIAWLKLMPERDRMFKALIFYIGATKYPCVTFHVEPRHAGSSKYTLRKSISLALSSFLQFSIKPLRVSIYLGVIAAVVGISLAIYTLFQYLLHGYERTGYATLLTTVVLMGSVQLFMLGIIGEYIGRLHLESKKRPLYFAREKIENAKIDNN